MGTCAELQRRELLFHRPQRPTLRAWKSLQGLGCNRALIERADVSVLDVVFDPPKRKSLGAAHIGTHLVDPARAVVVEKRAGTGSVRIAAC